MTRPANAGRSDENFGAFVSTAARNKGETDETEVNFGQWLTSQPEHPGHGNELDAVLPEDDVSLAIEDAGAEPEATVMTDGKAEDAVVAEIEEEDAFNFGQIVSEAAHHHGELDPDQTFGDWVTSQDEHPGQGVGVGEPEPVDPVVLLGSPLEQPWLVGG